LEQRSLLLSCNGLQPWTLASQPETKRRIMVAGSRATFFDEGPPNATQSSRHVRALDFQGMGKSSAMGQEPTHTIRPASCRCRPIAVSFHRLFLGGLLPSRARFRFAGCAHMESGAFSLVKLHYACRKNSHTERSPLDSATPAIRSMYLSLQPAMSGNGRGLIPPSPGAARQTRQNLCAEVLAGQ
jgi:hypothetical protein